MPLGLLLSIALRASFVLGLTFAVLFTVRRSTAALRRFVLLLGFGAALLLPLIAVTFPGRAVVHVTAPAVAGRVVAEALSAPRAPRARSVTAVSGSVRLGLGSSAAALVLALWAAGTLLLSLRLLLAHLRARQLLSRAAAESAGVRISQEIQAPVVIGLLRPVVLLPSAASAWSRERLQAAWLHESAHVRERDGLALILAQAVCALYWFQPLAWLALRALRRECELSADEDVLAAGLRPTAYAEHLLAIARAARFPAAGIGMAQGPSELGRRIQVLLSRERLPARFTRGRAGLLVLGALPVLLFVACTDAAAPLQAPGSAALHASAVDARLQRIVEEEARRVHAEWGARRVAIVVLDPRTGAVLASSDDTPGQPVVPASTLKPLTVAMALDGELITPVQQFDCGNGARAYGAAVLRDAGAYGLLDAAQILAVSSNVGVSRIFDVLGGQRLGEGLRRFGVGAPESIPSGSMRGAIIAMGEGSMTTPVALAAAYGVFANGGVLAAAQPERVIKDSTARTVRGMLEGVVTGERATGKAAAVAGVRVGGKTGTSDDPDCETCAHSPGTFASFVGIVPIDAPRWVIYVGVGEPKRAGSGGTIAAPAFARIASRALSL